MFQYLVVSTAFSPSFQSSFLAYYTVLMRAHLRLRVCHPKLKLWDDFQRTKNKQFVSNTLLLSSTSRTRRKMFAPDICHHEAVFVSHEPISCCQPQTIYRLILEWCQIFCVSFRKRQLFETFVKRCISSSSFQYSRHVIFGIEKNCG